MKWIGKIIGVAFLALLSFALFPIVNKSVDDITSNDNYSSAVKSMAGVLPLVFMFALILGGGILVFGGMAVVRYLNWNAFGNRLKLAYTAKFGGENPQFNEAVDQHIQIVRTLSLGTETGTKKMAEEWLKRMAHMVEVKFSIPEEEYMSETEKTKMLAEEEK